MRFDLTDRESALLAPLMPKSRRRARIDDRKIVNRPLPKGRGGF
jgi:transposase